MPRRKYPMNPKIRIFFGMSVRVCVVYSYRDQTVRVSSTKFAMRRAKAVLQPIYEQAVEEGRAFIKWYSHGLRFWITITEISRAQWEEVIAPYMTANFSCDWVRSFNRITR